MDNPTDTIEISDDRRRPFYWLDDIINDIHAPSIRASGIAVYTALVKHSRNGLCQVGIETIAAQSGLSNRESVILAIERLETARLVEVTVRPGHPNSYRILDPYQTDEPTTRPRRPNTPHPAEKPRGSTTDPAEKPRPPRGKTATNQRYRYRQQTVPEYRRRRVHARITTVVVVVVPSRHMG